MKPIPKRAKQGFLAVVALGLAIIVWSVGTALASPGTDSVSARLAEWARNHYLGSVVTLAENLTYSLHKPKVGGKLNSSDAQLILQDKPTATPSVAPTYTPTPPIDSVVKPALPGEGEYKTVLEKDGIPVIQVTYLRADSDHTSYLAGVARMNGSMLRFAQFPGFSEPGHLKQLNKPDHLAGENLTGLAATFNSGFKMKDSLGGYYQNGVMLRPLTDGKAALVIYSDGHMDIGSWNKEVKMTPDVVSVRQNLAMLVDNGQISSNLTHNVFLNWGWTVKNAYYVWRSAVGITANGDIVYVAGNALSISSLANLLVHAGAVRAMELDINGQWISYMWYQQPGATGKPVATKLMNFSRPPDRYFYRSSRDFFAAYLR